MRSRPSKAQTLLVALFLALSVLVVPSSPAQAVGSYDNAAIADRALTKVGLYGGQCRSFVNEIVKAVSGGSQDASTVLAGGDYFQSFINAGGTRITDVSQLIKGDIVQIGQWADSSSLHTFIIVGRVSGSTFRVVDSNSKWDQIVRTYDRTVSLNDSTRAFRMGRGSDPFGYLDVVSSPAARTITVRGWAADPDLKAGPLSVHVYANGQYAGAITANKYRKDVADAYPGYGLYLGYDQSLTIAASGSVNVCTYAINAGAGTTNTQLGCKTVTVAVDPGWVSRGGTAYDVAFAQIRGGWEMFHIGDSNVIYRRKLQNGVMTEWQAISGPRAKRIAAATSSDGRVELFYIGLNDSVYHHWESTPGGNISNWESLGGVAREITAARSGSSWEVFHVGTDGRIYRATQSNHAWQAMPGTFAYDVAAATSRDGRVELFHIGSARNVFHAWQTAPGAGFTSWQNMGGIKYDIGATSVGNGEFELYAIGGSNTIWRSAPWSGVNGWQLIGGTATRVSAAMNPDGRAEVLVLGTNRVPYHAWQKSVGSF